MDKQVCSLDRAKRLANLGVAKKSLYVWSSDNEPHFRLGLWNEPAPPSVVYPKAEIYPAFTVAELGEMLPGRFKRKDGVWFFPTFKKDSTTVDWYSSYLPIGDEAGEYFQMAQTEANSRASMLIYLIENKLIHKY